MSNINEAASLHDDHRFDGHSCPPRVLQGASPAYLEHI